MLQVDLVLEKENDIPAWKLPFFDPPNGERENHFSKDSLYPGGLLVHPHP